MLPATLSSCTICYDPFRVNYFVPGTGKSFGVTDFINPDELSEPVQQVFYSTELVTCSSLSFGITLC
jgi:hypothetical protein